MATDEPGMLSDILDGTKTNPISSKNESKPPPPFDKEPPDQVRLRKMFDEARDLTQPNRLEQQKCRDYYDGPRQLKSETRRILNARGQPPIYTNRVRPAIDGTLGVLEGAKTDPRAYPRNPADDDTATVATKTLRYIGDVTSFQQTKLECAENFLIEGTTAAIIGFGDNIEVEQIRWEEFFYDPRSRRNDFKDARYMGIAKWMDADVVRDLYPERYAYLGDPLTGGLNNPFDSTWDDRPNNYTPWVDLKRRRLMVVELYYNEGGDWFRCVYCAAGVFDSAKSAYTDDKQRTVNPIEASSCYVDRENNRYGRINDMLPIQDEVNARRSRLLHLANSRQAQEASLGSGAGTSADTVRKEMSKADGVIPTGWQAVPTQDLAAGQQVLLVEAKAEIERMGPTPAVLGRLGEASQSGRARQVLQQAGLTELARPLGRLEDWETRCYKQMFHRAQQFWTGPMWIRVTDETRAPEFLQINEPAVDEGGQPVLDTDPQTGMPKMQPVAGPDGQPQVDPQTGQPAMQPVQKVNNRLAEMDMDIIVDTVPDTANLEQEVWADMVPLMQMYPVGDPRLRIAVEMSPMADKSRVVELLKAFEKESQQGAAQEQAANAQLKAEAAQEELQNKNANSQKLVADAEKARAQTEQIELETVLLAAGHGVEPAGSELVPPPQPGFTKPINGG